jgi:hypothetical protein
VGIAFPPAAASILLPNPLATGITPFAAVDRRRGEHESMLVAIQRYAFTNDKRAIVDRFCYRQDLEVTIRHVAKEIQIVHLSFDEKEGVFRVVAGGRRPDDHAGGIEVLLSGDAGSAGGSTQRSQVGKFIG